MARNAVRTRIHKAAIRLFAENGSVGVNVSALAAAADVARGTIYNNLGDPERLFEEIVVALVRDMHDAITERMAGVTDPAERVAFGIRAFVERAHVEPDWGRFLLRFAFADQGLRASIRAAPARDLSAGIEAGRFRLEKRQVPAAVAMLVGAVIAAMKTVLDGEIAWRVAAVDTIELCLRAAGMTPEEAQEIALREAPRSGR